MSQTASPVFPEEIASFYGQISEESRLATGPSQLEFERTKELIARYLPASPATVLAIGGAAGAYSFWLADKGHNVHLVDALDRHIAQARRRSQTSGISLASCQVGDARQLPHSADVADAVLLMGPMYHLTEATDRQRALDEVHRVLKPGGIVFVAAISRFASALDGLARDLFADPAFTRIVQNDLESGVHENSTANLDYFTTAYFHRPDEIRDELVAAAFRHEGTFGLEGPGWILSDFNKRWNDPRTREDLLRVARDLEQEPSMIGVSAHLLAVGAKI